MGRLGSAWVRRTSARERLIAALSSAEVFQTARELSATIEEGGSRASASTTYRNLRLLVATGEVEETRLADATVAYRLADSAGPTAPLVCRVCGTAESIARRDVDAWASAAAQVFGFCDLEVVARLSGVCGDCVGGGSNDNDSDSCYPRS